MKSDQITKLRGREFWIRQTPSGGYEYRKRSKVFITLLPIILAPLLFKFLVVVGNLENGPEVLVFLALSIVVLMTVLILLAIIISLIEYLQKYE